MKKLHSFGAGSGGAERFRFAGVGVDDPKKDHSSHLDYHSCYTPPLLVSIAFPHHITRSIRVHHPPLLLSVSSSLERNPSATVRLLVAKLEEADLALVSMGSMVNGDDTGISTGESEGGSEAGESRYCSWGGDADFM
jgi:hypothetical protein